MRKLKMHELKRFTKEEYLISSKIPVVVILDNVRSMNNVGSVFRSCDAFAIEKLYLCGITPVPPHREINKTAIGATETVNWEYIQHTEDIVARLKKENFLITGIEQIDESVFLNQFEPDLSFRYAIVFGNEINGISDSILSDLNFCLEIPQYGTKHSINVSVAAGIVMFHFCSSMK